VEQLRIVVRDDVAHDEKGLARGEQEPRQARPGTVQPDAEQDGEHR
jgi:hypothetical protein